MSSRRVDYKFFVEDIIKVKGIKVLQVLIGCYDRRKRKLYEFKLPQSLIGECLPGDRLTFDSILVERL